MILINSLINKKLDIIIFGGTGDLSTRKLLPSLYMAYVNNNLPKNISIFITGRRDWKYFEYVNWMNDKCLSFVIDKNFNLIKWNNFIKLFKYIYIDICNSLEYVIFSKFLTLDSLRIFYLSTSSNLFTIICDNLYRNNLIYPSSRIVLEKPLGYDLKSAKNINEVVSKYFIEKQIYRIDHYLGKETVQNLMILRFGNSIFNQLWQTPYIRNVQIIVAESIGVGNRAEFYDCMGAMRDMVQNHLLQLLCIVAMESPISINSDDIRDEKLKVLRSLRFMDDYDVKLNTVRGQYTDGIINNKHVKGYLNEDNIPIDSKTETFVALRAYIDNYRWANVPFYICTGKRIIKKFSEIIIEFSNLPFSILSKNIKNKLYFSSNKLIIQLQPSESIQLQMLAKKPGSGMYMLPVNLNLDLKQAFIERRSDAYERLLIDIINGRLTHFMRYDELEAAWSWIDPIIRSWKNDSKLYYYKSGTFGPDVKSTVMKNWNYFNLKKCL